MKIKVSTVLLYCWLGLFCTVSFFFGNCRDLLWIHMQKSSLHFIFRYSSAIMKMKCQGWLCIKDVFRQRFSKCFLRGRGLEGEQMLSGLKCEARFSNVQTQWSRFWMLCLSLVMWEYPTFAKILFLYISKSCRWTQINSKEEVNSLEASRWHFSVDFLMKFEEEAAGFWFYNSLPDFTITLE